MTPAEGRRLKAGYLVRVPEDIRDIPKGQILVHSNHQPGFFAWYEDAGSKYVRVCDCGWAWWLGEHYRVSAGQS